MRPSQSLPMLRHGHEETVSKMNDDENLVPQAYLTQQTSSTGVALLLPKDTK